MPRLPLKLSYDNHLTLGIEVRQTRNLLSKITLKLVNNTPKQGEIARAARRAERAFNDLRHLLDNAVAGDFPDREFRGIYYGNHEQAYKEQG